jgi:hypothetical protein
MGGEEKNSVSDSLMRYPRETQKNPERCPASFDGLLLVSHPDPPVALRANTEPSDDPATFSTM